jgi:RNA polymerase sigma-70 factor (ECF subfamily)
MNGSAPAAIHRSRSHGRIGVAPVDAALFQSVRPRLFGIAYRVLGNRADADDVVQDTWLRWQRTDRSKVRDAAAFLATTTTRLAINLKQSARARRVTYIGPWLPDPVDAEADTTLPAEQGESVELAVLMLLEKLTPAERAVYVLREAFDYPYRQISQVLGLSEANARQLVTRARNHLSGERRNAVSATEQRRFVEAFLAAAQTGDLARLEQVLAADVVAYAGGGGAIHVSRLPVSGRAPDARFRLDVAA